MAKHTILTGMNFKFAAALALGTFSLFSFGAGTHDLTEAATSLRAVAPLSPTSEEAKLIDTVRLKVRDEMANSEKAISLLTTVVAEAKTHGDVEAAADAHRRLEAMLAELERLARAAEFLREVRQYAPEWSSPEMTRLLEKLASQPGGSLALEQLRDGIARRRIESQRMREYKRNLNDILKRLSRQEDR